MKKYQEHFPGHPSITSSSILNILLVEEEFTGTGSEIAAVHLAAYTSSNKWTELTQSNGDL